MKKPKISTWQFNVIYLCVLCSFVYAWPYMVYQRVGHAMETNTARENFIAGKVNDYALALGIHIKPVFRVGEVPSSAGALSGASVVIVSPAMLDPAKFSDLDVEFILAHEVGHLSRLDAYRFWTTWRRGWAEKRESAADVIAVSLVGCGPMAEAIKNHREAFMLGYLDHTDPHPHPQQRYKIACGQSLPE